MAPLGPPFAVRLTVAPAATDWLKVSDQATGLPSTLKSTPTVVPAGVAAVPWFFTVALNVTGSPTLGLDGERLIWVTTKSGLPVVVGGNRRVVGMMRLLTLGLDQDRVAVAPPPFS